ncbi:MAG: redoxin domain-containing protein [bacterium]|nr:redoxin domain-containing protein [bacterium]
MPFTLLDDGRPLAVDATATADGRVLLAPAALAALGWTLRPEGLCRDATCVPVRDRDGLATAAGVDLGELARLLGRPLAVDVATATAALGASAAERGARLRSLEAPDVTLPALDGTPHALADWRGRKVLLLAFSSWCGCRHDLPAWQAIHAELAPAGFTLVAVALDRAAEDVRPWVDAAAPTFPVLLDAEHRLADLYRITNVPTGVWIDEAGRIVRPNDAAFSTDTFVAMTGAPAAPHLAALRAWVRDGVRPFDDAGVRARQMLPTPAEQQARTQAALARHLLARGEPDAAERQFQAAEALAPHDWTIRRGSMWSRGKDPFGADLIPLMEEWTAAGRPYYPAMRDPASRE